MGCLLAEAGVALVCGGLSGVSEAACKGACEAGGLTIGFLPGEDASPANPYVRLALPTGMGEARNTLIVRSSPAAIAIGGAYGTLSEIAFALRMGKRVVGLNTWELRKDGEVDSGIILASTPEEAVSLALSADAP